MARNRIKNRSAKMFLPKKHVRVTALGLLVCIILQISFPTAAMALTSGPQQPEASNFTPADVSNLVDPFTGDFSYNIPMFDIGGYPVNLSYNSGASMDQEASWVGLGWNLNTGAITRDVRGLPDDFWGDPIKREFNTKANVTAGGSVSVGFEFAGFPLNVSQGLEMKYNNYSGFSVGETFNAGTSLGGGVNLGLGLATTNGGLDINPNVSFSNSGETAEKVHYSGSLGFGLNINSRTGMSQMSLNCSGNASGPNHTKTSKRAGGAMVSAGIGGPSSFSSTIDFLNPTWTPQNSLPYQTSSFTGSFKIGGAVTWADISGSISGFYTKQELMTHTLTNPGYGYMYSEKGQFVSDATHDFNREKDGTFTNNTPALPLTNYTYDAFNIKAQGIGGSFRAFRNDVGHVFDPDMTNPSVGAAVSAEVDIGNIVDVGADVNINFAVSTSGKWKEQNAAITQFKFRAPVANSINENVFFKLVGEKVSESDPMYLDRIQKDKAVSVKLEDNATPMALNQLQSNTETTFSNNNSRDHRMVRNTSVQCFTVAEMKIGFPNYVKYLPDYAKDHHIGMIIITTADGTRYVFGLPAYNKIKREVSMAVGKNMEEVPGLTKDANNMVQYSTTDASIDNDRGIDNYYDVTETPAFIYTWYLTEVLSPDYGDLTGNGPTEDDLGGYVKFSYGDTRSNGRIKPNIQDYKWRTPSSATERMATFSMGLKTIESDDKATYLYGEKDIWYPSSIESKTQYVKFEYSNRMDGLGVTGEHEAVGGEMQQKIEKIKIYSRQDYVTNSVSAIPLKTIHFEYDYSLCPGVFNNSGTSETVNSVNINAEKGKLTLKKVYFTYRNSNKAKYSSYSFGYAGGTYNPSYDPNAMDRWGAYRNNDDAGTNKIPLNEDYPYALQDANVANMQARCWNLEEINLPTGGKINVEYESDDYAYVQNRKACRMFQIAGAGDARDAAFTDVLYQHLSATYAPNNYLFFKLEEPISSATSVGDADEIVKKKYFFDPAEPESNGPTKYLYFRFLVNANKGNGNTPANEYVSGYADVDAEPYCGVWTGGSGDYQYGWVKLKGLAPDGGEASDYNQVSKAGWSFSRINTPFYANDQPVPGESNPEDFLRTILNASIINQLILFFQGPNNALRSQGFASKFVIYDEDHPENGSSWIRLYDPDGFKLGGGQRVKSVKISDNWEEMEGDEESFQYGQEYVYTNEEGTKSSGVASYEPLYGADENPFRIPAFYDKEHGPLVPDERFYLEEPFGESFFPSPLIGYSRVKIMNLQRENVTKTATGYTVKEFYTARDFPTKTSRTDLTMQRAKIDPLLAMFSPFVFDFMTNSQGFCIELNDMHGKPRKESVYQEGNDGQPISFVEHFYQQESATNEINNYVPVLEKNGSVSNREIGTEIDLVTDFRETNGFSGNVNISLNLNYSQLGPIPLIAFTVFPDIKLQDTRYRSATATKVVNRYSIEVKTEATDLGSLVSTQNKYFNGISGEPLITQVNNEYEDDRYTVSVPAYWAYPDMGHSSSNEGYVMLSTNSNTVWDRGTGEINYTLANLNFTAGDEVIWYKVPLIREPVGVIEGANNYYSRLWVARDNSGDYYFIDRFGEIFTYTGTEDLAFKVIRSGKRNILEPKVAEYAMLENPIVSGALDIDDSKKILSVTASTFAEQWKTLKRYTACEPETTCVCQENPWAVGYLTMLSNILQSGTVFDDANGASNGNLLLYNSDGYYFGFNSTMFEYFQTISGCTADGYTRVFLNKGSTAWDPMADSGFLSGSPVSLTLHFTNPEGYNCNACIGYDIALVAPDDVPAEYYANTDCTEEIDGTEQEAIMYFPVVIDGVNKYIKMTGSGTVVPCGRTRECEQYIAPAANDAKDNTVNPYIRNILGKWRANESYTLIEDRTGSTTATVNLRDAGYIDGYSDFWRISGGGWTFSGFDTGHWKRTTTVTDYHPSGPQVEEKNALDIYSAAQYGYFEQLAVAVAQNTRYKELGFDGFEDYDYLDGVTPQYAGCTKIGHFRFDNFSDDIVNTQFHTGKRSLRVASGTGYMERDLQEDLSPRTDRDVPYTLKDEDLLQLFGPTDEPLADKQFVFSFWVKQDNASPILFDYTSVSGNVKIGASSLLDGTPKKSPIINGWQKFEYLFTIPASASGILKVELVASGVTAYFDDVRIHPFNGMMKSYVYDPLDLRFMAELDENNFATFYEYDEDGALVRVKKETERGIMTIQENRYGSYKY